MTNDKEQQPKIGEGAPASIEKAPEQLEAAADQLSQAADNATTEFEQTQTSAFQGLENDAQSGDSALSPDELAQVKKKTGLVAAFDAITQKVRRIRDDFKERAFDKKVRQIIADSQYPDTHEINFDRPDIIKLITSLTPEQLKKYPEIIESAKREVLRRLTKESKSGWGHRPDSLDMRALQEVLLPFQSKPQVLEEITNQPEAHELQEKIFSEAIYDAGSACHMTDLASALLLDHERAKEIIISGIKKELGLRHEKDRSRGIHSFGDVLSGFPLDFETRADLALEYFSQTMAHGYPWLHRSSLENYFLLTDPELDKFLKTNQGALEQAGYVACLRLLKEHGPGFMKRFWETNQQPEFGLVYHEEEFRKQPNFQEAVHEAILTSAREGRISGDEQSDYQSFESLSDRPVQEILASPDGQRALYLGALHHLSAGKNIEWVSGFMSQFKLNLDTLRSMPEALPAAREIMKRRIKDPSAPSWPSDITEFLGIPDEQVRDLKIMALVNCALHDRMWVTFKLIDSINFTEQEQREVSKELFGAEDRFDYLVRLRNFFQDKKTVRLIWDTFIKSSERFVNKTDEQLNAYIEIAQKISDSPSQEMIRIKDQLIDQILMTDDPIKTYEIINNIFIQNNIPLVGKVQRIFDALHPDQKLAECLTPRSSPVLRGASSRLRRNIIFQDLLKVHVESGNRSLKNFLQLLKDGEPLMARLQNNEQLSEPERKKLTYIFGKLKTTLDVSLRGQRSQFGTIEMQSLVEAYQELCRQLGVKQGQTVSERVVEMFARPLGYQNIDEILTDMDDSRQTADRRSRQSARRDFQIQAGDLVKGVKVQYIDNILQNGSVAKEFLGANSGSDATPLDTDIELLGQNLGANFEQVYDHMQHARGYGEAILVLKDHDQFQKTSSDESAKYDKNKYELFRTGALGENHYGIRTGFSCTEVDFMILNTSNQQQIEGLYYSIAQNGYYVPVVDRQGKLVFTPTMYDEYRKVFAGIARFEGQDMEFVSSQSEGYASETRSIIEEKKKDAKRLEVLKSEIRGVVVDVLDKFGVNLKAEYDDSLLGAELLDIGSTGRGTNMVGEGDFDFNLKLDVADFEKVDEMAAKIQERLSAERAAGAESPILPSSGNHYQLRFFGTNIFSQKGLDIDIGFVKKSDLNVYASHDAIADKLNNIRQKYGDEAYQETIANILLAKKWLKAGKAYKKKDFGDGGLGGIGVENLVLAYGGNVREAFGAFYRAAKNSKGSFKNLDEFKKSFKILDAGMDLRSNHHDDFVYNMNEAGYQKMLAVIQEHFPDLK